MSKRIIIALTSHDRKGDTGQPTGAYVPEIAHPHAIFTKAGHTVEFVSVRGGAVPLDGTTDPDPTSAAFLADRELLLRLHASAPSSAVQADRFDAILFAGGHGTMWDFPADPGFQRLAARIYAAGGVVGAVCHGPAALVDLKLSDGTYLVAGKQVTGFSNAEERALRLEHVVPFLLEDRLVAAGGRFVAAPPWQPKVVVSERLVTGQNPASAAGVAEAMVELLAAGSPARSGRRAAVAVSALLLAFTAACGDSGGSTAGDDASTGSIASSSSATDEPSTGPGSTTGGDTAGQEVIVIPGFDLPESAFWSADEQAWFVSNIGGELGMKDGDGFISRLAADGTIESMQWLTGLDAPAGLRGANGKLYVADIDRLHAIDIAGATIEETVPIAGAMFLNDVTLGPDGAVYVSDTVTQSVHRWQPGAAPELVLQTPDLTAPNGLIFKDGVLLVGGIGSLSDPAVIGKLQRLEMGALTPVGTHEAKYDGIELDGADLLVTEFTGKLQRISGDGETVTLLRDFAAEDGLMSTADLGFDPVRRLVVVPDLSGGNVALYTLPD